MLYGEPRKVDFMNFSGGILTLEIQHDKLWMNNIKCMSIPFLKLYTFLLCENLKT